MIRPMNSFISVWLAMQWNIMTKTGKGYRMYSLKHTGKNGDRRTDKLNDDSKIQRMARNQSIGVR